MVVRCAVKVISTSEMAGDEIKALHDEVGILREIDHPNVVKLFDFFEDVAKPANPGKAPRGPFASRFKTLYIADLSLGGGKTVVSRIHLSQWCVCVCALCFALNWSTVRRSREYIRESFGKRGFRFRTFFDPPLFALKKE